ncbi:MAG: lamin tail domain-containing protein, partial [Candidatus Hadarchaeales archaeon]
GGWVSLAAIPSTVWQPAYKRDTNQTNYTYSKLRNGAEMVWDGEDSIYLFPGSGYSYDAYDWYKYSISGNSWSAMSPSIPGGTPGYSGTDPKNGPGNAAVCVTIGSDKYLYVQFGHTPSSDYTYAEFWRFKIPNGPWEKMAKHPYGADEGSDLVWDGGDYIYHLPGAYQEGLSPKSLETRFLRYSISGNTWEDMPNVPVPNVDTIGGFDDSGSAVIADGVIYAYKGGSDYPSSGGDTADNYFFKFGLTTAYKTSGVYVSKPIDAGKPVAWKSVKFTEIIPSGTSLTHYIRFDGGSWINVSTENLLNDYKATTVEYKVVFSSTDNKKTPRLDRVEFVYAEIPRSAQLFTKLQTDWSGGATGQPPAVVTGESTTAYTTGQNVSGTISIGDLILLPASGTSDWGNSFRVEETLGSDLLDQEAERLSLRFRARRDENVTGVRIFVEDFSNAKIGVTINRDSSGNPGENIVAENSVKIYNRGWVFVGFNPPAVLAKDNIYHIVVRMIPVTETENWWIQDTWVGGPGQQLWSDNTKFYENENVNWSIAGKIKPENLVYVGLPPGIANHVVISEVFYDEAGSDENEYIELYNPTASAVDISNWTVKHYNETGTIQFTATIPSGTSIAAHGFYLLARKSPISPNNSGALYYPDLVYSGTLQNGPGDYIILSDSGGNYVDGMKWGFANVAGEVFITDAPDSASVAIDVAGGHSLERKSASTHDETKGNGYDTNNNATDTRDRATPQPQNSSSPTEDPGGTTVTTFKNGWFTSSIYDASSSSAHWMYIDWTATVPTGTSLVVKVRFDNSSSGILGKSWITVSNGQSLNYYARYAQYRVEFSATDNTYAAELDNIRLMYGLPISAGPENYYVTSEPNPLVDGSSRVGTVLSGSLDNTRAQDGVYEKIGEVSLGSPATETDYEAATQVVTGSVYSGTPANLDADDSTYYEVDAASSGGGGGQCLFWAENTTRLNVGTGSGQAPVNVWHTHLNVDFTPSTTGNYIIIANAHYSFANTTDPHFVRFLINDVESALDNHIIATGAGSGNIFTFAAHKLMSLTAGTSYNFKIQFMRKLGSTTASWIENSRIIVLWAGDDAVTAENESLGTTTSTTPVDRVTLTFTPPSTDNYLVISSANAATNTENSVIVRLAQGTTVYRWLQKASQGTLPSLSPENQSLYGFAGARRFELSPASQTFKLSYAAYTGTTALIRYARVTALRLSQISSSFWDNTSEAESTTTSTTYVEKMRLEFNAPETDNYIIVVSGQHGISSASYNVTTMALLDGNTIGVASFRPRFTAENAPIFITKVTQLDAGPHTVSLQFLSSNTAATARLAWTHITVLKVSAPPAYSLDVRHDSGQVTASQSSVDNIYVKINFKSENTATYTWQIYDFTNSTWLTLNTGSVGTTEVTWENYITVNPANYISDDAGRENIRVRIFTSNESSAHRLQEDYLVYKVNYTQQTTNNYKLNWEHRISGIPTGQSSYTLKIYGYRQGNETIGVYVRNFSTGSWELVGNLGTSPGWLTKTISGASINNYLSEGAMSVRYYEGTADTVQDNVYIDLVAVETGAAGTGSITQTTWTGGPGENTGSWSSKFWISENIDWENQAGDLKLQGTTSYENYGNRFIDNESIAILNLDSTSKEVSMRFTAQASKTVENVRVYIHSKVGVPPGSTYTVSIHSNSGGNPGTQLASGTLTLTGTPPRWESVHLSSSVALTAGNVYHIKVKATGDPFANSWSQTRWQEEGHEFWNQSYDNWFWDNYQVSLGENITLGTTASGRENYGNFFLVTSTSSIGTLESSSLKASMRFTAQETKSVTGASFYVDDVKGQPSVRVSLYSDSGGNPNAELAYGTATISSTGWQTVNFTGPYSITQGTVYHLVIQHVNSSPDSWTQTAWTTQ